MKLQLSMRRLRLIFVIFEILFEKLKIKLQYAIKYKCFKFFSSLFKSFKNYYAPNCKIP